MNFQDFFKILLKRDVAIIFGMLCISASTAAAQSKTQTTSTLVAANTRPMAVAERNNLYCAGFVQTSPMDTSNKLVGAVEEQDQFNYAENDVVYINMGTNKGVKVGDMFSVVRPSGQVSTRWTKKNRLGFYVREVGALEVIRVKEGVSVARVKTSCDNLHLGDLVQTVPVRTSPMFQTRAALDLYAEPTGKARGRLFMARDNQQMLGREQIVYIDLGAEDNMQVGDFLTIFRPLEEGTGTAVKIAKVRDDRPARLRKIVGEMVILNVKERTATAVITRTAQEIHTGDWVEVQ
ncbi:MAG: hypothetical protein H0V90_08505 [Blastocatellia bacterium]|nr:hypothetical protein [Blastocatellia bacterium]